MKLVIGASGNVGKNVVFKLKELGEKVIVADYNIERARDVFDDLDGLIFRKFDFLNNDDYKNILDDVESVFFIRPPSLGDPKDIYPFVDLLDKKNIEHVIFLSLMGVEHNPIPPHAKIEKYIENNTNLNYTFLRPSFFMQNLIYPHGKDIKELNKLIVPVGKSKTSFIDAKDIGEVAAVCLHEGEKHYKNSYTLTGYKAYDYYEVSKIMSEVLDKKIVYTKPSTWKYRRHMLKNKFNKDYVKITQLLYFMTIIGTAKATTEEVQRILKRKPTSLEEFVNSNKENWL